MASHIGTCTPRTSEGITSCPGYRSSPFLRTGKLSSRIKAVAEKRDNLDHLQRASLHHSQPKKASFISSIAWPLLPERVRGGQNGYSRARTPWAIKEGVSNYKIRFDMPGMTKNDVKVWVEESMLVVNAEKISRNRGDIDENAVEEEERPTNSCRSYRTRIALPEHIRVQEDKSRGDRWCIVHNHSKSQLHQQSHRHKCTIEVPL